MWCCDVNACFGRAGFGPAASVAVRSFRSKGVAEYLSNADTPIYVYIHIYIYTCLHIRRIFKLCSSVTYHRL